jgi:membrane protein YdbS with pleckstrin-like domain
MNCNQCGHTLPEGSSFCNNCGAQTVAVRGSAYRSADVVPDRLAGVGSYDEENIIFTVRPTLIFVLVRYIVAALITIATAAFMGVLSSMKVQWLTGSVAFFVILGVGLIVFANPIYHHILRKREVYTLTNHKLEMRYGLIAKIVRNIPLRNIQDVTVTASVWQRFLNLGDIEIDSASETGKIVLDDIHHPDRYANMILAELRQRRN